MSKKLLSLIGAVLGLTFTSFGQCTVNTTITTPGYYPDSATGLPAAIVTIPYNTVMQVRVVADTTVPPYGTIAINYVQMDSIIGLPTGFTTSTNPTTGKFPGGGNGCILLAGNPVAGQELGGPAHNGIYPLTVYYHSNVQVPVVGATNVAGNNKRYHITVLPASAGILEETKDNFNVFQNTPNPAVSRTDINYWLPNAEQVEFRVYDVLGNLVTSRMLRSDKGNNTFTYDTANLNAGIYLYSIRSGDKSVSRRMIVAAH
ncbi:MAG TPA: T9SS type A sorting domain-containing protein [Bacteroidia bacterium]|jgi:hypothetical protein|nr:T9SS type A sorting domain-containing protein [Bacteroidia bacterium]